MTSKHAVTRGWGRRRGLALAAGVAAALMALTGCGASSDAASSTNLNLVGFSILEQPNKQVFSDFEDTSAGKGVTIITPNPGSSGSARWNILAAWGSVIANGGSEDDAKAYLTKLFNNTVALP